MDMTKMSSRELAANKRQILVGIVGKRMDSGLSDDEIVKSLSNRYSEDLVRWSLKVIRRGRAMKEQKK